MSDKLDNKRLYWLYLFTSIPTIIVCWYLGFPRGYLAPFLAIPITVITLQYLNDELVKERAVWKEYIISSTGLIFVLIIGTLNGTGSYVSFNDLYFLIVGTTVFELGLLPILWWYGIDGDFHSQKSMTAWLLATTLMIIVSFALFIIMDIRVVAY